MKRKDFLRLSLMAPLGALALPPRWMGESYRPAGISFVKPGDPEYELLRNGFNRRINKRPALIADCRNAGDVAEAVKYAAGNRLPVAVKSGGHCMEGYSVNNGGLVINLSAMNTLEWTGENRVRVAPACTLARLYDGLLPRNKIIPGGSCAGVAVGGLTLGGGYGLLSRKFGLTCDSLQSVTMVDGNGKIHTASGNDELIWACRGGNNGNFGVVTSLEFMVHPAPKTLQSHRFRAYRLPASQALDLMKEWFSLTRELPDACFSAFVLNGRTAYILLTNAGRSDGTVQRVINTLKKSSSKTTATTPLPISRALKAYYGRPYPLFFKNASAGLYKNFEEIEGCLHEVISRVMATPGMIYQVNTLGGNIQRSAFAEASAFPHRDCLYFSELQTYWEQPSQEKRLLESFEQVQAIFRRQGITAQYRNYPDIRLPQWETAYYGEHYRTLQRIKSTYDPQNLFRFEQSIRPV